MTQAELLSKLQHKLSTSPVWGKRALKMVFSQQTGDERSCAMVRYHNNVGFRVQDVEILTSFARQLHVRGTLSPKQEAFLMRKMPKYARQLIRLKGAEIKEYFLKNPTA